LKQQIIMGDDMSKKLVVTLIIMLAVTVSTVFSGCTTAQSRRQNQRIEDLERRVSRMEFDNNDGSSPGDDLSKYRDMARSVR